MPRSYYPDSPRNKRERPAFTVYVNVDSLHARPALLGLSEPREVEVRRHRRPAGDGNWQLVEEAAERLNDHPNHPRKRAG